MLILLLKIKYIPAARHVTKYHNKLNSVGAGSFGKKTISKSEIEEIQKQSALIVAKKSLSKDFFNW